MDRDPPSAAPGLLPSLTARSRLVLSGRRWLLPLLPAVVLGLLLPVASLDPVRGVTASQSPFTDEAWYALNARNLVLLGGWGDDDWRLHLITLPYALLQAASFAVLGVGIVQARVPVIFVTAITAALLGAGLQRTLGAAAGLVAAVGFATSTLILYYGRLAYAEHRYVVPLLPALAILAGLGAGLLWRQLSSRPALAASLVALALLALAAPGLLSHAGWVAGARATLPGVQAAARSALQDGAAVEGTYAPVVAMSAPVPILVSRPASGVNAGDLYAEAGVRWVVAGPDERRGWVDLHPEAWAGRREVLCFPWGGSAERVCRFQVP